MPHLERVVQTVEHGQAVVKADFRLDDGRLGSVTVLAAEHAEFGDTILLQRAEAIEASLRPHKYRAPQIDRYRELR